MTLISKRKFITGAAVATVGSVAGVVTNSHAQVGQMDRESGLRTGKMKPIQYTELAGFLSAEQIAPHYNNHYGGALRGHLAIDAQIEQMSKSRTIDANAHATMQRGRTQRGNSALLHEVFFDGMTSADSSPRANIRRSIEMRFGSIDNWQREFAAAAASATGWAVLAYNRISEKLYNVVSDAHADGVYWQSVPIIALDMYEHSYYIDYQNNKAPYIEKYFDYLNWQAADNRFVEARK
ncbi:MAG: hypothetical protein HOJ34_14425 [Kordiimonadaceae bacterium]|jgi:superoxide dismutase, Fe-Mn family|nr:hypothetical protein [Kordiimonadaceae bacterium]